MPDAPPDYSVRFRAGPRKMAKVLVADDDSSVRQVLRHILEAEGHVVWEAADGDQAAYFAITQSFDLVILDLVMPNENGAQAAREILSEKPCQKMIFMSGVVTLDTDEFREIAKDFRIRSFLAKPFHASTVVEAVERALCG